MAGPGLPSGGGEVVAVAALRPGATRLVSHEATVAAVLASLDGAGLAHIAAHGTFRSESPMFSNLQLADGPLTVDDIHRLAKPPHRIVLPACRSGVVAAIGGQDVIGFASALLTQGHCGSDRVDRGRGRRRHRPGDAVPARRPGVRAATRRGPRRCASIGVRRTRPPRDGGAVRGDGCGVGRSSLSRVGLRPTKWQPARRTSAGMSDDVAARATGSSDVPLNVRRSG
ncbi:CHAT domain-containing protein [Nocardioides sp. B-3]|uniref:CHAT domain-containing protein n=1 Tax=Nocardioides sp. B-3 TaxID=2895565 RepID=UPI0021521D92|nr:CHAT domain-containing protein [Nocardioides sp. B-3]UUZ61404.1 CHAT domain-containing protein [Nocardioides sp. B-3]